uniref:Lysophospholipid acyltransferase n=1 Tax=Gongylonema pulchrum TaxID=637853 RepID=A0A183D6F2_9BILA
LQHFAAVYIKPQYRIAPYIIGLCLGYHLAKIQNKDYRDVRHSSVFVFAGWAAGGLNWRIYYLFYGALHRTIFALAIAWLVYACHTGYGGFVNAFLSCRLFLPASTLCYSVRTIFIVKV